MEIDTGDGSPRRATPDVNTRQGVLSHSRNHCFFSLKGFIVLSGRFAIHDGESFAAIPEMIFDCD